MITSPFPQALEIRMYRAFPYYPLHEYFEAILLYRKKEKKKKVLFFYTSSSKKAVMSNVQLSSVFPEWLIKSNQILNTKSFNWDSLSPE